ncbi:iron-containing alcohol dehydrogenase [Bacteroides helcogenes]|uniref:Iron-containing alcohol dehydrogenase n=1 Tax=Bacteroides helcogenes (strain ATCC 35417 / DSM 20613 / JCM 6297 / CCUG 15421 / P 36-108) TaxID=693979 RepID=E6SU13_BACT6|nr:iron-containing alcohol dehydrogenase [Bacteroides helcogenes]ADV43314.1 iron-containing alcohol dehydrogenase [Bacteroides helcogenes P 36-108]MDY5238651.1 iron-containing alcohol dehydrogenase [Bacteroides helcogenes]
MENFNFCIGTNIVFGKDEIAQLPALVKPFGCKVLLTYGGGSIKRIGLYDRVKELLSDCEVYELSGIAPNPKLESVEAGAKICKEHGIDVIVAVGGGSVIDCSKGIAAAALYDGEPWDIINRKAEITQALPIIAVPTMAATGSEMDAGAVVSNPATKEKVSFFSPHILPKASILDPTYTFTVSAYQTASGCADILSHLWEQYFVAKSTFMSDMLVESVIKTIIHYAPIALAEPENYEARAQLLWGSNIADNATLCNGNGLCVFGVHAMEHELSAYYDIAHGVGLAILTPHWMRYVLKKSPETVTARFAHYGRAVWGLEDADETALAQKAIQATDDFLHSLNIPMTLKEVGIGEEHFKEMAAHCVATEQTAYSWVPLDENDVESIFKMCL